MGVQVLWWFLSYLEEYIMNARFIFLLLGSHRPRWDPTRKMMGLFRTTRGFTQDLLTWKEYSWAALGVYYLMLNCGPLLLNVCRVIFSPIINISDVPIHKNSHESKVYVRIWRPGLLFARFLTTYERSVHLTPFCQTARDWTSQITNPCIVTFNVVEGPCSRLVPVNTALW